MPISELDRIDVTEAIDAAPVGRFQILVFVLCAIIALIDGFDTQAIAFVAPAISEQWKVSPAAFGTVFGAGLAGLAVGAFVLSPLADRFGRRLFLLACTLIFGSFSFLTPCFQGFSYCL